MGCGSKRRKVGNGESVWGGVFVWGEEEKKESGEGHGEVSKGGSFATPRAAVVSMTSLQNSPL